MEINRAIINSLKNMGLTATELAEYIKVIKEEEEEQLARTNAIRKAREDFAESLLAYLLTLDIITEEDVKNSDLTLFMESIEQMEKDIFQYVEFVHMPKLDAVTKKTLKKEKEKSTTTDSLKEDFKVIEDWLASLGI